MGRIAPAPPPRRKRKASAGQKAAPRRKRKASAGQKAAQRRRGILRSTRNIRWIERHCRVPEGKDVGKRVKLRTWQKRELRKIYDNPAITRNAIISFAKKNGKTALVAFLLLLHTCGPEARPNTQLVSTAQSRDQASVIFNLAKNIVYMSRDLESCLVIRESKKEIFCPGLGTLYRALSSESSTAHGLSPIFAVHDELGQVRGAISDLYNAVENAMGAHDRPLSIVISTQAPTDNDLLSRLIDDASAGADPHTVLSLYTADLDLDPFSVRALKQANPAYGDFLSRSELQGQAARARRMPAQEPQFRNYNLNQRVEAKAPFVSRSVWELNAAAPGPMTGVCYGGLDLSEVQDLTAFVLICQADDGFWDIKPFFWLPEDNIHEKSRQDRETYDIWAREGLIELIPGKSIEYKWVAPRLWEICQNYNVHRIGFDRYNYRHLKPWLIDAGFSEQQTDHESDDALFRLFGQGWVSMSPALREMEALLLNGKFRHGNNPVLKMCAVNAVVKSDSAGNRVLDKGRSRGRIDGMAALADAIGVSTAGKPVEEEESFWMASEAAL